MTQALVEFYIADSSEEWGTRTLLVADKGDDTIEGLTDRLGLESVRAKGAFPVTRAMAELFRAIYARQAELEIATAANDARNAVAAPQSPKVVRDRAFPSTAEIREAISDLTAIDPILTEAQVIIMLPSEAAAVASAMARPDGRGNLVAGDSLVEGAQQPATRTVTRNGVEAQVPTGKALAELALADLEAAPEAVVAIAAEQAEEGAPNLPGDGNLVRAVLRSYRMYAADPVDIPYAHFPKVHPSVAGLAAAHDENCVVNFMIQRYQVEAARSKKIAEKSIRKFFDVAKGGEPTLAKLDEFCRKYKVPFRAYDITGKKILGWASSGSKSGVRKGLALMAWNNHAYFYDGDLHHKVDFSGAGVAANPFGIRDSRRIEVAMTAAEEMALKRFLKMSKPNFSFRSERRVQIMSLLWVATSLRAAKHYAAWDMTKAFHTAVQRAGPGDQIPVFTVLNEVRPVARGQDWRMYAPRLEAAYLFVSEACLARWRAVPYLAARLNNIVHGLEAAYLFERGYLTDADIVGVKAATYALPASKLKATLAKIDAEVSAATGEEAVRKSFALYNGMLGRKASRAHRLTGIATPDDCDLLEFGWGERLRREEVAGPAGTPVSSQKAARLGLRKGTDATLEAFTVRFSERRHIYLNNRSVYDWVVARTNLEMMRFIDAALAANPGARVVKIKTDGVVFASPLAVALPAAYDPAKGAAAADAIFHEEPVKLALCGGAPVYVDPAALAADCRAEVAAFFEKAHVVTGAPGTGKTYSVKKAAEYDLALAFTNTCARNLDATRDDGTTIKGETLHTALRLNRPEDMGEVLKVHRGRTIWVDEFSMLNAWMWSVLFVVGACCAVEHKRVLILTGDPNQCQPVGERLDYGASFLAALLSGAQRLEKDYRNGADLVRIRGYLENEPDPEKQMAYVRREIADRPALSADAASLDELAAVDVHIVATHRVRRLVNHAVLRRRGLKWEYTKSASGKVSWTISDGVLLRARKTRKRAGIFKGTTYRVVGEISDASEGLVARCDFGGDGVAASCNPPIRVTGDDLRCFDLGYAMTAHSSQGATIRGAMVIHECDVMIRFFGDGLFYTALTRACRLGDIRFSETTPAVLKNEGELALAEAQELLTIVDDFADPILSGLQVVQ